MNGGARLATFLALLMLLTSTSVVAQEFTIINSQSIELVPAGDFDDASEWDISSTAGFSNDPAEHTVGMVADGELSFTHARPDNFETATSWAQISSTDSNYSLGEPDTYYTWSKGPNITVGSFDFSGLHNFEIENVSLILHFAIPDALHQDSVRVILQNTGQDKLVRTFARTFQGIYRMSNPLVLELDNEADWDWSVAESARFTIDYVSVGTSDDSEVRVDAVGLRVKYHEPWYSFENIKAIHHTQIDNVPVMDISVYEGQKLGLDIDSCGLIPDDSSPPHTWLFDVEAPYGQELGRIHTFGTGNHTIEVIPNDDSFNGDYMTLESGDLLQYPEKDTSVRITIEDGCVSGARIDINDPHIIVRGSVTGSTEGLSTPASSVRLAIGTSLVATTLIENGQFNISVPVGHALPGENEELIVGIAARFQWSSDGTAQTSVVHVNSLEITGGYHLDYDYAPECLDLPDQEMDEDEGGILLSLSCTDDLSPAWTWNLFAEPSDSSIVDVSTTYSSATETNYLQIQTIPDASGETIIAVRMQDELGNAWYDNITLTINPVEDAPVFDALPLTVYMDLGDTLTIPLDVYDADSNDLSIGTSRSWATVDSSNNLHLSPVDAGLHTVNIIVSDGTTNVEQELSVSVSARSDLVAENVEVRRDGSVISHGEDGDVVEIHTYVRNEGRGVADGIDVRCYVDDVFVGSSSIDTIPPGGLGIAICDAALPGTGSDVSVRAEIDGTQSIDESNEENNVGSTSVYVAVPETGEENDEPVNLEPILFGIGIAVIVIGVLSLQFSPGRVKKPYRKQK